MIPERNLEFWDLPRGHSGAGIKIDRRLSLETRATLTDIFQLKRTLVDASGEDFNCNPSRILHRSEFGFCGGVQQT